MLIEMSNLKLSLHGRQIPAGVNLHMQSGEICGLPGPNGAGKSTTLCSLNMSGCLYAMPCPRFNEGKSMNS
jgi:ABC-type hemin transport system ATPase subunit